MLQSKPCVLPICVLFALTGVVSAQDSPVVDKPGVSSGVTELQAYQDPNLVNADIIQMVQAGYSEAEILMAIEVGPIDFEFAFEDLTALRDAGVSEEIRMAMMKAEKSDNDTELTHAADQPSTTRIEAEEPEEGQPFVRLVTEEGQLTLSRSDTHVTQTKAKGDNLASLAADSAVDVAISQALASGMTRASWEVAKHSGSALGAVPFGSLAAGAVSGIMSLRKPKVTFLWALPGIRSEIEVTDSTPVLEVHYGELSGIEPTEFEPVLVKCLSMAGGWRLIGATRFKAKAIDSGSAGWQLYSRFSQESVATSSTILEHGVIQLQPLQPLLPGQYSVVLRPLSATKEFAGIEIAQGVGDGMAFNSAWDFAVVSGSWTD